MALIACAAVAIAIVGMLLIDREARQLSAAEGAARDLASLETKLPGVLTDPELAVMGRSALQEIGRIAEEEGQLRIVHLRTPGQRPADWPATRPLGGGYVLFEGADGARAAGIRRQLADGSEVLVGRTVQGTGPLRETLLGWGAAIALLIIAMAALAAWIVGRSISRRIAELNQLCEDVEGGDVHARHTVSGGDEIALLARHMNRMLDELERRLEALRDTTDGLAHDLRTPLARVQGRLSRIEDLAGNDRCGAEIRLAATELDRLMESFNALLDLREIETEAPVTTTPFDVVQAVEDAIDLYEAVAEDEYGITIRRDFTRCTAAGNASLIVRAAANLIDNAIKASAQGSDIVVAVDCTEDCVAISVRDSGIGLTAKPRGQASTLGGHGIGLRIVRAVARRHGGEFSLTDLSPGARATLTLPRLAGMRQVS
ncbi:MULTISPECIES: HAMP domain-containing sensor histidine kinase [Pacificimonas]|uniref:histidine kinase n=1 Tax=Pacificimonas aurantium TaxID=1250540 RepID=A0ABS7WI05_9SPHN|nr:MULTISPECIES: HAMP domain-containing sensor histidine kinase [Pacificimonas]MBZ6378012.1 HAMP domain-containing histidine kinase [Pacificimonas aurantium]